MKCRSWASVLTASIFFLTTLSAAPSDSRADFSDLVPEHFFIRHQDPEFMTYEELRQLSSNPHPGGDLEKKLARFWSTPVISNEAYYKGERPAQRKHLLLGNALRVVSWNIEKSYKISEAVEAFTDPIKFERQIDAGKAPAGSPERQILLGQQRKLMTADIVLLQEMDIGVKRSGYIDAPRELAEALRMNYAYAPEQLEVDPVMLGLEKLYYDDKSVDDEAMQYFQVDEKKEKGAFGVAVLSRYPIKRAESFQLKTQPYDWYYSEKNKVGFLEQSRRLGAKTVLENEITREMKVGGRIYFRVDLHVPGLPLDTLTIINIHLEIKCQPEGRLAQMQEILSYIKDIKNPVIVAGDFNAAPSDLSPTSVPRVVKRTLKNPTTWFSLGVSYLTAYGFAINSTRTISNVTRNYQNPLARNVPVVAPNSLKALFETIEKFRFADGGAFDFRGDRDRSINGKDGALANSNQRDFKGFKTTFSVKRPVGIWGKYRLDWFFVKSYLKDPRDPHGPYKLAPHFGETLEELNTWLNAPISDHHPNVIELPLEEPKLPDSR